ncbi:hypothetical protein ACP4OV_005728 [Aristida adscensionis]
MARLRTASVADPARAQPPSHPPLGPLAQLASRRLSKKKKKRTPPPPPPPPHPKHGTSARAPARQAGRRRLLPSRWIRRLRRRGLVQPQILPRILLAAGLGLPRRRRPGVARILLAAGLGLPRRRRPRVAASPPPPAAFATAAVVESACIRRAAEGPRFPLPVPLHPLQAAADQSGGRRPAVIMSTVAQFGFKCSIALLACPQFGFKVLERELKINAT